MTALNGQSESDTKAMLDASQMWIYLMLTWACKSGRALHGSRSLLWRHSLMRTVSLWMPRPENAAFWRRLDRSFDGRYPKGRPTKGLACWTRAYQPQSLMVVIPKEARQKALLAGLDLVNHNISSVYRALVQGMEVIIRIID